LLEADNAGTFGIRGGLELRDRLKPRFWFAAHHHFKFATAIEGTEFRALAKPGVGGGQFWNEVVEVDADRGDGRIRYCGEWIAILRATRNEMEGTGTLADVDWNVRIEEIRGRLESCEDAEVGAMEDPVSATVRFCRRFGVFCPNPEIRRMMECPDGQEIE
jgi:lariat debranching enzyme